MPMNCDDPGQKCSFDAVLMFIALIHTNRVYLTLTLCCDACEHFLSVFDRRKKEKKMLLYSQLVLFGISSLHCHIRFSCALGDTDQQTLMHVITRKTQSTRQSVQTPNILSFPHVVLSCTKIVFIPFDS